MVGSCKGLDVGFPLPVVVGSRVGSPVGISLEGNIVVGASVGDWLGGDVCGCNVESVGLLFGDDKMVGVLLGNKVAVTLGAATGASVGSEDVGKLVEGDAVVGLEVASVG